MEILHRAQMGHAGCIYIRNTHVPYILENAAHCGASLSERLKSVVGFLQLLKTVFFFFIFRRTRSFAWCRDSVIGERFEVYVRA